MAIDTSVDATIVNLLLQNGASTELYDEMDCTPFQLLFLEPGPGNQFQFEKFQLLLEAGASVNTRAAFGAQPLHNSVKTFNCEEFIKAGAMVNAVNTRQECALQYLDTYTASRHDKPQEPPQSQKL